MTKSHAGARARSTGSRSLLALSLGLLLAGGIVGGWIGWKLTYVHGQEACVQCHARRRFDRRGPFWMHSEVESGPGQRELCAEHQWQRVGCWQQGGMSTLYGPE